MRATDDERLSQRDLDSEKKRMNLGIKELIHSEERVRVKKKRKRFSERFMLKHEQQYQKQDAKNICPKREWNFQ